MERTIALATVGFVVLAVAVGAGGPAPTNYPHQITYVPAAKHLNAIAHGAIAGQGTNELVPRDVDLGVRVSMGKKAATPPVSNAEVHATFGHVYLIEEGEGTLVLGGELDNAKENRPGEWTGPSIKGGQEYHMKKGDMITVQVGMPHWWKQVGPGGVAYLAFHSFPAHNQPPASK
jgi:mannose-6-phosphate isomerase-like protein (cupin superfamily)